MFAEGLVLGMIDVCALVCLAVLVLRRTLDRDGLMKEEERRGVKLNT